MVAWVLLETAVVSLGIAAVYSFVAYRLYERPVSSDARLASLQFSVFWYALGATAALGAVEAVLAAGGVLTLSVAITISLAEILIDCVFLWAIVDFLVYVYTGKYYLIPVSAFYALFYVAALYYTVLSHPYELVVRAGLPTLLTVPVTSKLLVDVVDIGLVFPEFVAAFLYLSLLRRTEDRGQRFRITVVGLGIVAWFGLTFFFPAPTATLGLVRSLLQLIPAVLTLLAYFPPPWIRERLQVHPIPTSREADPARS